MYNTWYPEHFSHIANKLYPMNHFYQGTSQVTFSTIYFHSMLRQFAYFQIMKCLLGDVRTFSFYLMI